MILNDILTRLATGELRNLSLAKTGTIEVADHGLIVGGVNHALKLMYSRFVIERDFLVLRVTPHHTKYEFRVTHNESDTDLVGNTAPRYIVDSVEEPFTGRFAQLIDIRDPDDNVIDVDIVDGAYSVRRLAYDRIWTRDVPIFEDGTITEQLWTVEYAVRPEQLTLPITGSEEIVLPDLLEEALLAKAASRVFASMGGEENLLKAKTLDDRYEILCADVETRGILPNSVVTDRPIFTAHGFK